MKAIVFSGPSVSREAVTALKGVAWRPPVSQGDVYRAAKTSPRAIAIIDGFFDSVPSVWHKEILWAMSRGIRMFGASSMGALRAAELHQFGMRGVGEIFEKYRDGTLEDDDEVAVLHGPAELGYTPLSVPMVNARSTIENAVEDAVIGEPAGGKLTAAAKSIFFQDRQWAAVVHRAHLAGVDAAELTAFEQWLPGGERDLKRQDAEALLAELSTFLASEMKEMRCDFDFEWTVMWDTVAAGSGGGPPRDDKGCEIGIDQLIIDELRLSPTRFEQFSSRARLKQMALREAGRARIGIESAKIRKQLHRLRESLNLYSRAQLEAWLDKNDWTPERLEQALEDEQRYRSVTARLDDIDDQVLLDELRFDGAYEALKESAQTKQAVMSAHPTQFVNTPAQLVAWYFEKHLGEPIPVDIDGYLLEIGIRERKDFYRMIERQYRFEFATNSESQYNSSE